jgi:hypothetical protein
MKILGRWSLASFMKLVVDVCYYAVLVVFPLVGGLLLLLAVTGGRQGQVTFEVPVRFHLAPESHPFSTDRSDIEAASITDAQGTLKLRGGAASIGYVWAGLGVAIIVLAMALFILSRLRAVFRTLREQNPFVPENSRRIRSIGIALILGDLVAGAFAMWLASRVTGAVSVAGVTIETGFTVDFVPILTGVILIMLAEVFRIGAQMKGDLETARKIQFDLVPGEHFEKKDVVVQARMRPARSVGGDYYDVFDLDEGHLGVVVGDVAGKGLPAALLMTSIVGSVRALLSAGLRGSELLGALNRHTCANTSSGRFVTLFYGELDVATGRLTYVNAGHNPPFLLRADGRMERLEPTAMVLGVMADAPMAAQEAQIGPADRLVLFTDGLSEAFNAKEEEYGETRLADSVGRSRTLPPPAAIDSLTTDVLRFCGTVPLRDDMTLMLVARQPA